MSTLKFRPRFHIETALTLKEVIENVKLFLKANNPNHFQATLLDFHIHIRYPKSKVHYWSPQLDISLEENLETNQTKLRCLIGPQPKVWTMFMFFYALLGFIGIIGLMLGMSQWTLENNPWGFWFVLVSCVGAIILWIISQQGQKMAHTEMVYLKEFIESAIQ